MYQAAGLAQLPRMPNMQTVVMQQLGEEVHEADPAPQPRYATAVTPCACGCGQPVSRAATGRPGMYASGACRMRALRARKRAETSSRA
jgi:hypothetical protein